MKQLFHYIFILLFIFSSCKKIPKIIDETIYYPNKLEILVGEFTNFPSCQNGKLDYLNENDVFHVRPSINFTINEKGISTLTWSFDQSISHPNTQNIGLWIYFKDSTMINNVTLEIYNSKSNKWIRSISDNNMN